MVVRNCSELRAGVRCALVNLLIHAIGVRKAGNRHGEELLVIIKGCSISSMKFVTFIKHSEQ